MAPGRLALPPYAQGMCLGAPGRIIETFRTGGGVAMGRVEFSGVVEDVCLEYLPDAVEGEYVFVHLGFATARLDEAEALRSIALLEEMAAAAEIPGPGPA